MSGAEKHISPVRQVSTAPSNADGHTKELAEIMMERYDHHLDKRAQIDVLIQRLRDEEAELGGLTLAEAKEKAENTVRQHEAQRAIELFDRRINDMQADLNALREQLVDRQHMQTKIETDLQAANVRLANAGHAPKSADALLQQLQQLEQQESHVRALEGRIISCEDARLEGAETLDALLHEHEGLNSVQGEYYQSVHGEMVDNQAHADELTGQLQQLVEQKQALAEKRREHLEDRASTEAHYQELSDVKGVLESDLKTVQGSLAAAEQQLTVYMEGLLGVKAGPAKLFCKMEETMMLLKAAAVNLHADFSFIGEVNAKASMLSSYAADAANPIDRGLQSFCDAYAYIRDQVEQLHGPQAPGERWVVRGAEVPLEVVEPMLSALKQLVTCYDMIPDQSKLSIPCAKEIMINTTHLVNLTHETSVKYVEMERVREEEAAMMDRAREEKKLRQQAKKYAPKHRDPYSRAPGRSVAG
eukprot:TRINITY_DN21038_c0_g1_i1.p1 TRINITY_DN21038_c0_g1~~TRINITY_DN21038_c0_g1_i1.p1  ORF type:complete len:474 (+),score=239.41 TRINITY_DN21038_c0_g1_i1:84-1505(+)